MGKTYRFMAFDLGAESGRGVLGTLEGERIALEEIHRFPTEGLTVLGVRQWDLTRIYTDLLAALTRCARDRTPSLDGIGVDTWGVDFGVVARDSTVLANPVHYRDKRTDGMMDEAFKVVPRDAIYRATGIQFMQLNTIFQLFSMVRARSPLLEAGESILLMGDLFGYLLSGKKSCEYTNASTTQLLDPWKKTWNDALVEKLGIPRRLLLDPIEPGTVLGPILKAVADETGIDPDVPVIAPATHDTQAAIAAVPASGGEDWAYLSSGTWSLIGAEIDEPCVTDESLAQDFTNEGGVCGKISFLKNIFGLWLVQECRREWARDDQGIGYDIITREAEAAEPMRSIVDVDDPRLLAPESMPSMIQRICREKGLPIPETRGQIVRCALESLAVKYRQRLRGMDKILGRTTKRLHIVGGGTQNKLLNRMAADACGIPVIAGPVEATALGNILIQALAVGAIRSLEEGRRIIADSFEVERYEPRDTASWDRAAEVLG
ncbi:rhamnulokinase [Candidatus Sumerlaeota bacterium]|nr:rhamnulokinase [Candidatus Sumerlaeota bacterium]